jgi:L-asparaginase
MKHPESGFDTARLPPGAIERHLISMTRPFRAPFATVAAAFFVAAASVAAPDPAIAQAEQLPADPAMAQAEQLPAVHVIATGGTISNVSGRARRTGDELVASLPGIERIARVTVEQFSNVASGSITPDHWRAIATRINELYRTRPELRGVVVTHGTDTLEETAYFLDLTVASCRPVIVTGAMRQASAAGADGPANLYNSIRAAAAPASERRGTLVLLNDEIFVARDVTKTSTLRTDAFTSPGTGAIGVTDPDGVRYFHPPDRPTCGTAEFDIAALPEFPRVDVVYSYSGADSVAIAAFVAAGARGLVVAGIGAGAATPPQGAALQRARMSGVTVIVSSRTGSGRVPQGNSIPEVRAGRGLQMGAGTLSPQKARILLMLALASTNDPARIARIFQGR